MVYGNEFAVNHLPLEEGSNTITVMATDSSGYQANFSIDVFAGTFGERVYIQASPQSAAGVLQTELTITGAFPILETNITYAGADAVNFIENNVDVYRVEMTAPGFYYFTVETKDPDANTHSDTVAVCVTDTHTLDALLKAKWKGMLKALSSGDKQQALDYFNPMTRSKYDMIFTALESRLPQIARDLGELPEIQMIMAEDGFAKYRIVRQEIHQGQLYDITYDIYFDKAGDGLWRIVRY